MSRVVGRIIRDLRRDHIIEKYAHEHRYIPHLIYDALKKVEFCERCGRRHRFQEHFEIHHKVPVRLGGLNERSNLLALCARCHATADSEVIREDAPLRP